MSFRFGGMAGKRVVKGQVATFLRVILHRSKWQMKNGDIVRLKQYTEWVPSDEHIWDQRHQIPGGTIFEIVDDFNASVKRLSGGHIYRAVGNLESQFTLINSCGD
jgi:hypothetical protein